MWASGTGDSVLPLVAGSIALVLLFVSTTNVVQVFFVKDVLGASDTGYGVVGACWMVGMVLAVPLMALGRCTRGALAALAVGSEAVTGVAMLGAGFSPSPVIVGAWYVLGGLGSSSMMIAGATLVQLAAPREARGRVLAAYSTLTNAAMAAALVLSVGLMSWLGARGVFLAAGALAVTAAALAAGVLWHYGSPRSGSTMRSSRRSGSSVSARAWGTAAAQGGRRWRSPQGPRRSHTARMPESSAGRTSLSTRSPT